MRNRRIMKKLYRKQRTHSPHKGTKIIASIEINNILADNTICEHRITVHHFVCVLIGDIENKGKYTVGVSGIQMLEGESIA